MYTQRYLTGGGRLAVCRAELVREELAAMKLVLGMDLETEVELSPAAKAQAAVFSPYSSPSTALLLQRKVVAWYGCLSLSFSRPCPWQILSFFVCCHPTDQQLC